MTTLAIFPSNSPAESYPGNRTSDFTIPLSEHLRFPKSEQWKVGLLEIQIPITFYNLDDSFDENIIVFKHHTERFVEKVPAGSYKSITELVREINKILFRFRLLKNFSKVYYYESSNTILIRVKQYQTIIFSPRVAKIFGLPEELKVENPESDSQVYRSQTADLWKDLHHLFIYSNITEDRIFNSSSIPLLGTVSIKNNRFGSLLVKNFPQPEVLKIRYDYYSSIHFEILNEAGENVRFRSGSVVLKLAFSTDAGGIAGGIN